MGNYVLTQRAETELFEIFLFGYEQFGAKQVESYASNLGVVFQLLLADTPLMGRSAENIAPGVRRHESGAHVILYEKTSAGVTILAVVLGSSVKRLAL